jgi:hypothetical protein
MRGAGLLEAGRCALGIGRSRAAQQFTQADAVTRAAFSLCLSRLARSRTVFAVVEIGTSLSHANCKKHCSDLASDIPAVLVEVADPFPRRR